MRGEHSWERSVTGRGIGDPPKNIAVATYFAGEEVNSCEHDVFSKGFGEGECRFGMSEGGGERGS